MTKIYYLLLLVLVLILLLMLLLLLPVLILLQVLLQLYLQGYSRLQQITKMRTFGYCWGSICLQARCCSYNNITA